MIVQEGIKNLEQLKYLKFEYINNEYITTLIDSQKFEIVRGYGATIIESINDLHSNLV